MKKLLISALVAGCVLLTSGLANAQTKIGYINFEAVVTGDPSFKGLQSQIETFSQTYVVSQKEINDELQKKGTEYQKLYANLPADDAKRVKAEGEITDIQKRLETFNQTAQTAIQNKQTEVLKPLLDKVKAAIAQVAKEKGYTYVFNTAQTELLVFPESDDLLPSVKAKIGGGAPAAAAPAKTPAKK